MDSVARIDEKKPHVVFIPSPLQGHIKCMLQLATLLHRKAGLYITFINTVTNHTRLVESGATCWLDDTPGFLFKTVPDGLPAVTPDDVTNTHQTLSAVWAYLRTNFCDSFLDVVSGVEIPVTCIVCDGFMTYTNIISAAEKLKIPVMLFWTMAACGFMAFYQTKVLVEKGILPLKDESYLSNGYLDMEIDWIPGMEKFRLKDLPKHMFTTKHDDPSFNYCLEVAKGADKVSHTIIHTFDELEANLIDEIKSIFTHVYTIGPLQLLMNNIIENKTKNHYSLWKEEPECLRWLNSKEPNSVMYVSFGSVAIMSVEELIEFGWGLVKSDHYFLWIIRTDLVDGKEWVLPHELKEEMKKKGFIGSWCSQEEVLNHPAVGGFLTHCGWGSIIESVSAGVPMLCRPFLSDQRTNCRQMCMEWEVGLEIMGDVKRDEIKKLVMVLMEGLEGEKMRKKALEWKKVAETATRIDGSSYLDLEKIVYEIISLSKG